MAICSLLFFLNCLSLLFSLSLSPTLNLFSWLYPMLHTGLDQTVKAALCFISYLLVKKRLAVFELFHFAVMMENERKGECEREIHGQQQYKPNAQEKWKMAAWGFQSSKHWDDTICLQISNVFWNCPSATMNHRRILTFGWDILKGSTPFFF